MPRRGRDLEKLVRRIEASLADRESVEIRSPGFRKDLRTNQNREFDVLITETINSIRSYTTGIECKNLSRPVDNTVIEAFHTKCNETGIDKRVIVSASGFVRGAAEKAKGLGIDLLTLRDATAQSWDFQYQIVKIEKLLTKKTVNAILDVPCQTPAVLIETRADGSEYIIPDGDSPWLTWHFSNIYDTGALDLLFDDGTGHFEIKVDLSPIDHFVVQDVTGARFKPSAVYLEFGYDEIKTERPFQRYEYQRVGAEGHVRVMSAELDPPPGVKRMHLTLVEHETGEVDVNEDYELVEDE